LHKPAACFIIHSLTHLRAALAAGKATGRPIVALSAIGASGFAGAGWFASLTDQGRQEFPEVELTAILDCADRCGDVLAALNRGIAHLIFTGQPELGEKLQDIASQMGGLILSQRPPARDLIASKDPFRTARLHCEDTGK
jgi:DNA-binding transcriptional LysR family regulator